MGKVLPTKEQLSDFLTDGRQTGALQKTLLLPMVGASRRDLLDPDIKLSYPSNEVEVHHIFPKAWCANTKTSDLEQLLDIKKAGRDWVNSTANLMPLSRKSNNVWEAKIPEQILNERHISFDHHKDVLKPIFIDQHAFDLLTAGSTKMGEFWAYRAGLIANDLLGRTKVTL